MTHPADPFDKRIIKNQNVTAKPGSQCTHGRGKH